MDSEAPQTALVSSRGNYLPALRSAIQLWAEGSTAADSDRHDDLVRYKRAAIEDFFEFTGKHPAEVAPSDTHAWRETLEARKLKPNTPCLKALLLLPLDAERAALGLKQESV
jgi:hypothetical protein